MTSQRYSDGSDRKTMMGNFSQCCDNLVAPEVSAVRSVRMDRALLFSKGGAWNDVASSMHTCGKL